jgi:hypothetical protein
MTPTTLYPKPLPPPNTTDTTRSWRVLKNLFPLGLSALVGLLAFWFSFTDNQGKGDTASVISNFETCLNDYVREAARLNITLPLPQSYVSEKIKKAPGLEKQSQRLDDSLDSFNNYKNEKKAVAELKLAISKNYKGVEFTTEELDQMESPWVKYSGWARTFRSLKISAFAGVSAYAGAWMLVVASAFCWYFLLDRLRDISQAVKGR